MARPGRPQIIGEHKTKHGAAFHTALTCTINFYIYVGICPEGVVPVTILGATWAHAIIGAAGFAIVTTGVHTVVTL